jgi:hypothetical protein
LHSNRTVDTRNDAYDKPHGESEQGRRLGQGKEVVPVTHQSGCKYNGNIPNHQVLRYFSNWRNALRNTFAIVALHILEEYCIFVQTYTTWHEKEHFAT